jgi:hypothetical protein
LKFRTTLLLTTPVLAITLCMSLFIGLMCVSVGAAFPPLLAIGGPLVCGGGEFGIDSQDYSLPNGERGTTRSPYCIDGPTGEKRGDLSARRRGHLIYSALTFMRWHPAGRL